MTIFEISKIIEKIGDYQLFEIDNVSYLEIAPSKFINGVDIKICDMSNRNHNKWKSQMRCFTYEELEKLKGE